MSIFPLPVFEADADPDRRDALTLEEQLERLEPPRTIVVRFGRMGLVGEYPSDGTIRPGCGSKLVSQTHRGIELTEMLTTTCTNAGCGKSVTRKDMRSYIEASGGKEYPFSGEGRILRIATVEDMQLDEQRRAGARERIMRARSLAGSMGLDVKIVDVEMILGGDVVTIYYMAEEAVDMKPLQRAISGELNCRAEVHQVGARDEARLNADYEKCGQHCCCKNFLKVLKPVSMRAAKQQKATLDPLKISGRCGRLMCCLRYEDQTYRELKANLPHRRTRVGTTEGPGLVIDGKILTQLVLVELEHDRRRIAVPLEELIDPENCPNPTEELPTPPPKRRRRRRKKADEQPKADSTGDRGGDNGEDKGSEPKKKRRRRRRRRRKKDSNS
ncbi:MAG: hypothetical protein MK101_01760 [Phycisphaerales bacterium]|nr:hypothetical protein [Phycisphaerales bacterium]